MKNFLLTLWHTCWVKFTSSAWSPSDPLSAAQCPSVRVTSLPSSGTHLPGVCIPAPPRWGKHKTVYSGLRFTKVCLKPGAVKGGGSTFQCDTSQIWCLGVVLQMCFLLPLLWMTMLLCWWAVAYQIHQVPPLNHQVLQKKSKTGGKKSFLCLPVLVNSSDPLILIKFSAFFSSVTLLYIQLCMYTDTHPHALNPMDCPNHFPFILQPHLHFQLWETALLSWGKVRASVCKCGKMKVQHLTQLGRSWGEQEKPFQHPCYVQE